MHIQKDSRNLNSIMSYDESKVVINNVTYSQSLIVSAEEIIPNWDVQSILQLTVESLIPFVNQQPEIIIFGHTKSSEQLPLDVQLMLSKHQIGFESMSIGPACRTFNILLSENRRCIAGIIF